MAQLDETLANVLRLINEADADEYADFHPMFVMEADHPIQVDPEIEDVEELLPGRMRALAGKGLIDLDSGTGAAAMYGDFRLTDAGRETAARAAAPSTQRERFDSSWEAMTRILDATVKAWEDNGGLDPVAFDDIVALLEHDSRAQIAAGLQILRRNDLVELEEEMGSSEPLEVEPLPAALARTRDWPSDDPELIARRLDDALAAAIERTNDPEEKTRLQRLRDDSRDVGKSVIAGVIIAAGKLAAGGGV